MACWLPIQFFLIFYFTYTFEARFWQLLSTYSVQNRWAKAFEILFLFKYIKVIVHTISFMIYKPVPIPKQPTLLPEHVTVIIPTVGDIDEPNFRETLSSILANNPWEIIICTVGADKLELARRVSAEEVENFRRPMGRVTMVNVMAVSEASKRKQIFAAIKRVQTPIIGLADDHVFWGPDYLQASLAPFEDPGIGGVGTNKRVRRQPFEFTYANFLNFIACNYLERHNFECTATVNIDETVFVLSGRTAFYRTLILQHPKFKTAYMQETWWFGVVGRTGFAVDDDNLLTRFTTGTCKYRIWFQNSDLSTMETTLGEPDKFFKQMNRWIRTTWRSNSTSLFYEQTPWREQPWSVYAIYLSSFVNFALFYDFALLLTFRMGLDDLSYTLGRELNVSLCMTTLCFILFLSKMIKPFPHFWRNPKDLLWIPGYVLFGYYHSLIKLYALLTVNVVAWGTRPGAP